MVVLLVGFAAHDVQFACNISTRFRQLASPGRDFIINEAFRWLVGMAGHRRIATRPQHLNLYGNAARLPFSPLALSCEAL